MRPSNAFIFECVWCFFEACSYVSAPHSWRAPEGQKRISVAQKLELQMIVGFRVCILNLALLEELLTAEPLLQEQYCVVTLPFSLLGSSRIRGERKHTENPRSNLPLELRSGLDAKQGRLVAVQKGGCFFNVHAQAFAKSDGTG